MATLNFSDALRKAQLTGRPVSTGQEQQILTSNTQADAARKAQLGVTTQMPDYSKTFADYQGAMDKMNQQMMEYQSSMAESWQSLLDKLNQPYTPPNAPFDPNDPTKNLAPYGHTPTMQSAAPGQPGNVYPGSYTWNPATNHYDLTNPASQNFYNEDPGRTVLDPATGKYVPATGGLQYNDGVYTMWDPASKTFKDLPSQQFGGSGLPNPAPPIVQPSWPITPVDPNVGSPGTSIPS